MSSPTRGEVQRKAHGKTQTKEEIQFVEDVVNSLGVDSFGIDAELRGSAGDPHVLDRDYVEETEQGYRISSENLERLIKDISTVNGQYSPGMGRVFVEGKVTDDGEAFFAYDQMEDTNYGMSSGVLTVKFKPLD
jgi:hypothetical protein